MKNEVIDFVKFIKLFELQTVLKYAFYVTIRERKIILKWSCLRINQRTQRMKRLKAFRRYYVYKTSQFLILFTKEILIVFYIWKIS